MIPEKDESKMIQSLKGESISINYVKILKCRSIVMSDLDRVSWVVTKGKKRCNCTNKEDSKLKYDKKMRKFY